jgi:toxin-antitoxin system PIN domain toxin
LNVVDVNVLILAHREDVDRHVLWRGWLDSVRDADEVVGLPGHSIAGFVRIVTNVRAFSRPSTIDEAIGFVDALLDSTAVRRTEPGPRHWTLFSDLCRRASATGKLVPDAWLAALAIENRATLITADRGFARYPGLKWRDPTADA